MGEFGAGEVERAALGELPGTVADEAQSGTGKGRPRLIRATPAARRSATVSVVAPRPITAFRGVAISLNRVDSVSRSFTPGT